MQSWLSYCRLGSNDTVQALLSSTAFRYQLDDPVHSATAYMGLYFGLSAAVKAAQTQCIAAIMAAELWAQMPSYSRHRSFRGLVSQAPTVARID